MTNMLKIFRLIIGYLVVTPFVIAFHTISLVFGKPKAIKIVGKMLSVFAAKMVELLLPNIQNCKKYPEFQRKAIRNFLYLFKPLYDVKVINVNSKSVEFQILNCPFIASLRHLNAGELSEYACAGDLIIAKKNKLKWGFMRTHCFGMDGKPCNHTYYAIESDKHS